MHRMFFVAAAVGLAGFVHAGGGEPQADTITYQGRFQEAGVNATGDYEFAFSLWDNATTGTMLDESSQLLSVTNGLFQAELPFGDDIDDGGDTPSVGDAWIQIGVRPSGSMDPFTVLDPRQPLTSAPRASYAHRSATTLDDAFRNGGSIVNENAGAVKVRGQLEVGIFGGPDPDRFLFFNPTAETHDLKVNLPSGSITSPEIGDEAGVASQTLTPASLVFLSSSYQPIVSQTIDCPSDGYIIAMANLGTGVAGTDGIATNILAISLDGMTPYAGRTSSQFVSSISASMTIFGTQSTTQVIPVSAGPTTVSLIARTTDPTAGYHGSPAELTLLYVPTAYGATATRAATTPTTGLVAPRQVSALTAADQPDYEQVLVKQRELEAKLDMVLLELQESKREQAEANGR